MIGERSEPPARHRLTSVLRDILREKQETTAFLAAARARGCETQIGIDMLFEQIPAYLEFFGFPSATPSELRAVAEGDY